MAETSNTALIAEIISDEIFPEFGWSKVGPINQDWECVKHSEHHKDTHPSDVVFFYREPYREFVTYVQTDLKSYATGSITKGALTKALESLAMQVSCAESSPGWQSRYLHGHENFEICGMLFIFNHDGGYDQTFDEVLVAIDTENMQMPAGTKIVVLGPVEIYWLYNVAQDIVRMRGRSKDKLPDRDQCSFFYPQPVMRAVVRSERLLPANLEMLTGPWIVMRYTPTSSGYHTGLIFFYRNRGETIDEFLYLLDFMRQHELFQRGIIIQIRSIDKFGVAQNNFQKARQRYVEQIGGVESEGGIHQYINSISYTLITAVVPEFSSRAIGMNYDR